MIYDEDGREGVMGEAEVATLAARLEAVNARLQEVIPQLAEVSKIATQLTEIVKAQQSSCFVHRGLMEDLQERTIKTELTVATHAKLLWSTIAGTSTLVGAYLFDLLTKKG